MPHCLFILSTEKCEPKILHITKLFSKNKECYFAKYFLTAKCKLNIHLSDLISRTLLKITESIYSHKLNNKSCKQAKCLSTGEVAKKKIYIHTVEYFSSVQLLSHVRPFVTPRTAAHQAFLSITNSWSLLKLMSIESVMPSNHLILCHPLLLLSSIFPSIRVFSKESALRTRWPKYWSFSFNISPYNEHPGLISFRKD